MSMRLEQDSMGQIGVPADAYWGHKPSAAVKIF